jgi:predicted phage tail protein|tara:strand:- start:665 stop:1393 length:729 start_codon:yes stop_codon:yes gene_type:complete
MKVVKVYGELRKRLGQCRFEFDVATPAQAVKALCVNFPGLDKWLVDSEQDGVGYRVKIGKEKVTPTSTDLLAMPWSEREVFSITPVVAGAGGNTFNFILGGLLIGASFFFPGAGLFGVESVLTGAVAGTGIGTAIGTGLSAIGAGLVLGGVADIISPMAPPGLEAGKEAARLQNMSFSGVVNTARQGLPVPIAYGRVFVGSAVISSGFDVDHTPNSTTGSGNRLLDKIDGIQSSAVFLNKTD